MPIENMTFAIHQPFTQQNGKIIWDTNRTETYKYTLDVKNTKFYNSD